MEVKDVLISKEIKFLSKGNDFVVRCLSPDHPDKHPSMRIDRITGIFNCFACGFKGNLFTHFGEQINKLQMRKELFRKRIKNKRAESIGLSIPKNSVPYTGDWRNIKPETYKKFEAFLEHSPEFVGRINFPIRSMSGRIVAFNGRHTTGGTPKYIVSPPGAKIPTFPVVKPISGSVILVEGIFDMLNLHDKGLTNTICCFGTSTLNEDKLSMLKIQGIDSADIFFDGDTAGQNAAEKVKILCTQADLFSRSVYLENIDPGALTQNQVDKLKHKLYRKVL